MTAAPTISASHRLQPPGWLWPLAGILGLLISGASLSYTPQGRINVLWLWVLWAGLALLGTLVSAANLGFGRARPWLFRWRARSVYWYPTVAQRLRLHLWLQVFWLCVGSGMLLGFWFLLLLTDLAFGWSSTLIHNESALLDGLRAIAWPWQGWWPAAVPDEELMNATRFVRIDPKATPSGRAGDWWPFLMASLVVYNLAPRLLLALFIYGRMRGLERQSADVHIRGHSGGLPAQDEALLEAPVAEWDTATVLSWELASDHYVYGRGAWAADEQALDQALAQQPKRLLWRVNASRSPVAELGDLIVRARRAGVEHQGLLAVAETDAVQARHIASWRGFCQRHHLVWVRD